MSRTEIKDKILQAVVAVQDESSHWYVIPVDMEEQFCALNEASESDYDAQSKFEELFSKYRTGGSLNIIQLYAEI